MKISRSILFLGISVLTLGSTLNFNNVPLFFMLDYQPNAAYDSHPVGVYNEEDFMEPFEFNLMTENNRPVFYSSSLRTTVCDDEVCEIMHIRLFWDLVGNYIGYDTLAGHPLTKFDHEPFTGEDYIKLHQLLSNDGSILKFKTKDELIDKEKIEASDVVDGTTGATALEIREEVVEGALYSSYTIWHIAYKGNIKNMLTSHTDSIYNEELKEYFLTSQRSDYELFALRKFTDGDFAENRSFLIRSLKEGIPLLRKFILKDMPDSIWGEEKLQGQICELFPMMDVNSRTFLLEKLMDSQKVHGKSLVSLSREMTEMNKNQLIVYLKILNNQEELGRQTMDNVEKALSDHRFQYAYLIDEHLDPKFGH